MNSWKPIFMRVTVTQHPRSGISDFLQTTSPVRIFVNHWYASVEFVLLTYIFLLIPKSKQCSFCPFSGFNKSHHRIPWTCHSYVSSPPVSSRLHSTVQQAYKPRTSHSSLIPAEPLKHAHNSSQKKRKNLIGTLTVLLSSVVFPYCSINWYN